MAQNDNSIQRARTLLASALQALQAGDFAQAAKLLDEAIQQDRKTLELDPSYLASHEGLGFTYAALGRYREALTEFEKLPPNRCLSCLGYAHAMLGDRSAALRILNELKAKPKQEPFSPFSLAIIYLIQYRRIPSGDHEMVVL